MDSNAKSLLLIQKCKEFLAFTSLKVRLLVDSSSCNNNKTLTNAIVMMISYFFDYTPPSNSSHSNTWHMHMYANNSEDGHWASARAVRVVQLFSVALYY